MIDGIPSGKGIFFKFQLTNQHLYASNKKQRDLNGTPASFLSLLLIPTHNPLQQQ